MHLDSHQCLLFKLASVRTSQQHVRTLFRVPKEFCVQVHPSGRRSNTIWTLFSVRQVKWFPSETQIWKGSCNCSDAILDKARHEEELQPSGRQGNTVRKLVFIMGIACSISATVRTLGQHHPDVALFRKENQHFLKSQLHSSPSGRPQLASICRLEKSVSDSI
jgi:hypothetical protein